MGVFSLASEYYEILRGNYSNRYENYFDKRKQDKQTRLPFLTDKIPDPMITSGKPQKHTHTHTHTYLTDDLHQ
jgi:hypothetical protein